VGGVAAYSTLGWFDDPLLSSMLRWDDSRLAKVVFHELAHQQIYAADDTVFNESFATAVAQVGLTLWLDGLEEPQRLAAIQSETRDAEFVTTVIRARDALAELYRSTRSPADKRARKGEIFDQLRRDYGILRAAWGGYEAYDNWMNADLNNAKIASLASYHDFVDELKRVLAALNGDFERFYGYADLLAQMSVGARHRCLESIGRSVELRAANLSGCPPIGAQAAQGAPQTLPSD